MPVIRRFADSARLEDRDRRFGPCDSGKGREVAVRLVYVGLIPVVRGVVAFFAGLVRDDHDQHPVFAVEVRGLGQPDRSLFVDLRLKGLDHGES